MPDLIVKIGGGLLASVDDLDGVLTTVAAIAGRCRVLVVPGGGPFADTVRAVDQRLAVGDDAAHWMAVLAMDQYAHLLVSRLEAGAVVRTLADAVKMFEARKVPVLAPSRWLEDEDPLPHGWDVTSDSIAAWVAAASGARELVLVKPRGASGDVVDSYFRRVLPWHVTATAVAVERADEVLRDAARRVRQDVELT
jgi:aspartokinase-like uncharacterized kinase